MKNNRVKYIYHPWGFILVHKVPMIFKKLYWHPLKFAFNKDAPWCLINYTDHSWDFGLIHKAPWCGQCILGKICYKFQISWDFILISQTSKVLCILKTNLKRGYCISPKIILYSTFSLSCFGQTKRERDRSNPLCPCLNPLRLYDMFTF